MGKDITKNMGKILSGKYGQKKFLDHAKKSATDAFKAFKKSFKN